MQVLQRLCAKRSRIAPSLLLEEEVQGGGGVKWGGLFGVQEK